MSVIYEEFEAAEMKKAAAQQAAYAATRRRAVEEQIRQLSVAAAGERQVQTTGTQAQKRQKQVEYTAAYAKNALQQAVSRRQWQQRLSEQGLGGSGLSNAVKKKAETQKQAADAVVTAEQKKAVDALSQKLAEWLASSQSGQQETEAKLRAAAEKEIAQNEAALFKAAKDRATSQYKAALSAAAKGVQAK